MSALESDLALSATRRSQTWSARVPLLLKQAALMALIVLLWQYVLAPVAGTNWVGQPSLVVEKLAAWIANGDLLWHLAATLESAAVGYSIGASAAILLAVVIGSSYRLDAVSRPFVTAGYSLPKEVIAPVFIILFGIGLGAKIALASISVFFIVYQNAVSGVRLVDRDLVNVMRVMGAGRLQVFFLVTLRSAAPWTLTGMRIAGRYAFTAVIFGEMLSGNRGLGYLIKYQANLFEASGVFAALLSACIVSTLLTTALQALERLADAWRMPE
ncbi:ABC transporter permease [Paraburkholderia sp.]|uniref:ABC transporter permease n=1 Tax=Paraburkholderia sp. TaxID=1926495 RepID=UPI0039E6788C